MPLPDDGPCSPWCDWDDVLLCLSGTTKTKLEALAPAIQEEWIAVATEILYNLSGRNYPGTCSSTRNVCRSCLCGLGISCCCRNRNVLDLDLGDDWPVARVTNVIIDGVTLTAGTDYRVDDWRWLVRLPADGSEPWPTASDLADPSAFQVSWEWGQEPPRTGVRACALFVSEFAKECAGDDCTLPERVTTVVREGVTYTIMDSMKMIDEGRTGLFLVDLWLKSDELGRQGRPGMVDPSTAGSGGGFSAIGTDAGHVS